VIFHSPDEVQRAFGRLNSRLPLTREMPASMFTLGNPLAYQNIFHDGKGMSATPLMKPKEGQAY